jgi:hypothetical protein
LFNVALCHICVVGVICRNYCEILISPVVSETANNER